MKIELTLHTVVIRFQICIFDTLNTAKCELYDKIHVL